ncbi:fumarylacetoacetase [soil metagenome]
MTTTVPNPNDPELTSWVESAQKPGTDFPIQNLPFGLFRRAGKSEPLRIGIAIGDQILDLHAARRLHDWSSDVFGLMEPLAFGDLNRFMAFSADQRRPLRAALSAALQSGSPAQAVLQGCLVPQADAELALPCRIGDYTDFYTSISHATTVGKLFRPDNPLLPNYAWVPIGYHGRSSTIGVSGQSFPRPVGQTKGEGDTPVFGPCKRLDYELELGAFIGEGNAMGQPIRIGEADERIFGLSLFNDWSARDIQAWEYQPLGPFLAKNFASTLSPWIVPIEAFEPFRTQWDRPAELAQPLPYLDSPYNREKGAIDVKLEVWLQTAVMREKGEAAVKLMQSNFKDAYWTLAQMVAHHTVNGCNLQPGDLLGTGTQSGPTADEGGSLLELSGGGKKPLELPNGEKRVFLQDGDTVILRGYCERDGAVRIGFGDCAGTVLPAIAQ